MKIKTLILVLSKHIFYVLFLVIIFSSCNYHSKLQQIKNDEAKNFNTQKIIFSNYLDTINLNTVVIDSCEYYYAWFGQANGGGSLTHKGNCKFCAERNQKYLKKLVIEELKNK